MKFLPTHSDKQSAMSLLMVYLLLGSAGTNAIPQSLHTIAAIMVERLKLLLCLISIWCWFVDRFVSMLFRDSVESCGDRFTSSPHWLLDTLLAVWRLSRLVWFVFHWNQSAVTMLSFHNNELVGVLVESIFYIWIRKKASDWSSCF